ncbi:DUF1853 family protein [Winogradskyella sediminis]|uniref:DUF1853 family protein n=1 Tax=Winogradskyella sediminis TaxID=1382466 RepID=UPI003AA80E0C
MDKSNLLRYKGYVKTPSLFLSQGSLSLNPIELSSEFESLPKDVNFKNQRLGKLVEEFVFYQLKLQSNVKWLVENIQIQKERTTIGELDALYLLNNKPIHLEVVYKFYLYDSLKSYNNPLSYWIGPNRKDTLCYKIDKLKNKQFPLLFKSDTKQQLEPYNIDMTTISQSLCFKAQLFLPCNETNIQFGSLNQNCVSGVYISYLNLFKFKTLKFYKPQKLDWLVVPHNDVDWRDYDSAIMDIEKEIEVKRSPLVWIKHSNTKIVKCFVTFW